MDIWNTQQQYEFSETMSYSMITVDNPQASVLASQVKFHSLPFYWGGGIISVVDILK